MRPRSGLHRFAPFGVVGAGALAYANSLTGEFVYDDFRWIESNPDIRSFDRLPQLLSGAIRPVWKLSLAANYAIGGLEVVGYHVVNGAIHLLAGLALLGVCRRTLRRPALPARVRDSAEGIALSIALLWTLHPLQTQAVTYVVQRCESGMGLCLLATLYASTRSFEAAVRSRWRWSLAAVLSCAIGMGTKEVMVVAPFVVWLHDRAFLSGSGSLALRTRPVLYAGLAACWGIPFGLIGVNALFRGEMARPDLETLGRLEYALNQPAVLVHYVRVALWPDPLVLSYGWPAAERWRDLVPSLLVVSTAAAAGAWGVFRNRPWGFVLAWFFVILAPTSSIQPIQDLANEHRMYLPLAAIVVAVVLGTFAALARRRAMRAAPALVVIASLVLGGLTIRRNGDYQSELRLWQTVTLGAPEHAIGHYNYGTELRRAGRNEEAIASLMRTVELDPGYANGHNNLANAVLAAEGPEAAVPHYQAAISADPEHVEANYNLANAMMRIEDPRAAALHYRRAIELKPGFADAEYGLGLALERAEDGEGAIAAYRAAVASNPRHASAHLNLGRLLRRRGALEDAGVHLSAALRLRPDHARSWRNLGALLADLGRTDEAIEVFRRSLELEPDDVSAQQRLDELLALRERDPAAAAPPR